MNAVSSKGLIVSAAEISTASFNEVLRQQNNCSGRPLKLILVVSGGYLIGTPSTEIESEEAVLVEKLPSGQASIRPNLNGLAAIKEDKIKQLEEDGPIELIGDGSHIVLKDVEAHLGSVVLTVPEMLVFSDQILGVSIGSRNEM